MEKGTTLKNLKVDLNFDTQADALQQNCLIWNAAESFVFAVVASILIGFIHTLSISSPSILSI